MTSTQASRANEAEKRRSTRVALSIAVIVAGVDALGEPFREATTTTEVNCYGCRYRSKNYVQKGSSVAVEIPHPELKAPPRLTRGRVVWVQRPRRLREPYEVAVEFEVAGNIWGIESPPKDWFPRPEEPKPVVVDPPDHAVPEQPVLEIAGKGEPKLPALVEPAARAIAAEREATAVAVEEMTFTLSHLGGPVERSSVDTLNALVARLVDTALEDIARQTTNRILGIISEAQQASHITAGEVETQIRQALDAAASAQSALTRDGQPPKRRKRSKRNKLTVDG
jgi:hypothetical protein